MTVFILLLVGAVAIAALENSGEEAAASGRSRAATRAVYAADAGVELAMSHIAASPPDVTAFDVDLGGGRLVQSRTRADTSPQPIAMAGMGPPPEGYAINTGSGYVNEVYLVNVTSPSPDGTTAEIEARLGRLEAGSGGY